MIEFVEVFECFVTVSFQKSKSLRTDVAFQEKIMITKNKLVNNIIISKIYVYQY